MNKRPYCLLLGLTMVVLGFGCMKLERTNPLDPRNPQSVRKQVVLAELFVNDSIVIGMSIDTVYDTTWCDSTGYYGITCDSLGCDSHWCDTVQCDSIDTTQCDSCQCSLYYCDTSWCDTSWCDSIPRCSLVQWCIPCPDTDTCQSDSTCYDSIHCYDLTVTAHIETIYDTTKYVNSYCTNAETALYNFFTDKFWIVYAQYHVKHDGNGDSLGTDDNQSLYTDYLNAAGIIDSVPVVFINGPHRYVSLQTSYTGIYTSVHDTVESLLEQDCHFTLEGEFTASGSEMSVSTKLARLGGSDYTGALTMHVIVMESLGPAHQYVVRDRLTTTISGLEARTTITPIERDIVLPAGVSTDALSMIVCLKDDSLNVLQTILVE